jgi:hypothetical protein
METPSEEKSKREAAILKSIQEKVVMLDSEYLEFALKEMREAHSDRESMAVLNPNPFTHNEQQDLNEAKLELFALILKMKGAIQNVEDCHVKLMKAKGHEKEMGSIFGNTF